MRAIVLALGIVFLAACGSSGGASSSGLDVSVVAAPPVPHGGPDTTVSFERVACAAPGSCAATGQLFGKGVFEGLLLAERQGKWTATEAPLPANLPGGTKAGVGLGSVSCPTVNRCVAVGHAQSGIEEEPLVFTEQPNGWRETIVRLPARAPRGSLSLVSCPAPGDCTAAGMYFGATGVGALLVSETRGRWGTAFIAPPPWAGTSPGGTSPTIGALSCPAVGMCAAVGLYGDRQSSPQGWLLSESGGVWRRGVEAKLPPNASGSGSYLYPVTGLASVSCASATDCVATGGYGGGFDQFGMFLTYEAGSWEAAKEVPLPGNAGPDPQQGDTPQPPMGAIACPSPGNCSAVGTYVDKSKTTRGLLLSEHDGAWTATDGGTDGEPIALACPSAGNCLAVGPSLVAERDGVWEKGGVAVKFPTGGGTAGPSVYMDSVSCPSGAYCVAVGGYRGGGEQGTAIVTIRRR